MHLRHAQTRVAEHAALFHKIAEIALGQLALQHVVNALAHGADAVAHGIHFALPLRRQFFVAQNVIRSQAALHGRAGINAAHAQLQLPQHQCGFFGIGRHHHQAARALPIQRHIFGKRAAHQHRQPQIGGAADGVGIAVKIVAKALVGDVHKRDELARSDDA